MDLQMLLLEVSAISKKYEAIYEKTGAHFNIFDIAGIATDELTICRVLYELLNPQGSHFQGDTYLRLFIEDVLEVELGESDYRNVQVYREYVINKNRRIDIVIKTENLFIPIEVKIKARDQNEQCFDYYKKANSTVYYLTLDRHIPDPKSAGGLNPLLDDKAIIGYDEVKVISFGDEILKWLIKCIKSGNTIQTAPIREILLQLTALIRRLTNQLEEGKEMEIQKVIMSSSANMISAVEIENSLKNCKVAMLRKIFHALEERLKKEMGVDKLSNEYDYEYENEKKLNTFYDHSYSAYPGISYQYKNDVKDGIDIWFRIEIEWRLYAGFCVPIHGKAGKQQLTENEIKEQITHLEPKISDWWAYWEYIPVDDSDISPDFKHPDTNNAYYKLFDQVFFDDFINKCVKRIQEIWK